MNNRRDYELLYQLLWDYPSALGNDHSGDGSTTQGWFTIHFFTLLLVGSKLYNVIFWFTMITIKNVETLMSTISSQDDSLLSKHYWMTHKMPQWIKAVSAKSDNLSFIPQPTWRRREERENQFP